MNPTASPVPSRTLLVELNRLYVGSVGVPGRRVDNALRRLLDARDSYLPACGDLLRTSFYGQRLEGMASGTDRELIGELIDAAEGESPVWVDALMREAHMARVRALLPTRWERQHRDHESGQSRCRELPADAEIITAELPVNTLPEGGTLSADIPRLSLHVAGEDVFFYEMPPRATGLPLVTAYPTLGPMLRQEADELVGALAVLGTGDIRFGRGGETLRVFPETASPGLRADARYPSMMALAERQEKRLAAGGFKIAARRVHFPTAAVAATAQDADGPTAEAGEEPEEEAASMGM